MAIEKIIKFSDAIQPADIINEVVDVVNNADLEEFVGASESQAGKKGIVPAPEAGSEDRYLNADGTWKEVKQNLTVYTSLEQIGITPGEETFESIHNALPINAMLIYYHNENNADDNQNDAMYPCSVGYIKITKLTNQITQFECIQYEAYNNSNGNVDEKISVGNIWETYYNAQYPQRVVTWNKHIASSNTTTQEIKSRLDFNNNSTEAIRLNGIDLNNLRDIAGYDTNGNKVGLLRFGKYDNGKSNGAKLAVTNSDGATSSDFVSLYKNTETGEGYTRLYQNVVIQDGALYFTSETDNNSRIGYYDIKSSTDITNIPQGNYFFYGNTQADDPDEIVKGWDIQGISFRGATQATQLLFNGSSFYYRYDDNVTDGNQPTYSSWIKMINSNGGTITGNLTVNGTITGTKVVGAVYNDYAEFFPRGEETEAGDIIMLDPNSKEEKYIKASTSIITEYPLVIGVHSEEYSHLIGGELPENGEDFYDYNIDKYIPIGLAGRCKIKIKGKAIKGAPVTISNTPGVGICSTFNNIKNNLLIGFLVESDSIKDENTIRLLRMKIK